MRAHRRAQSARPQGMSLANLLREAKGGACPPLSRSYLSSVTAKLHQIHVSMPALKCSVGIQRKSGSGFQPLRRGKMPRPLFGAEPINLADIVSRALQCLIREPWGPGASRLRQHMPRPSRNTTDIVRDGVFILIFPNVELNTEIVRVKCAQRRI